MKRAIFFGGAWVVATVSLGLKLNRQDKLRLPKSLIHMVAFRGSKKSPGIWFFHKVSQLFEYFWYTFSHICIWNFHIVHICLYATKLVLQLWYFLNLRKNCVNMFFNFVGLSSFHNHFKLTLFIVPLKCSKQILRIHVQSNYARYLVT